MRLCISLCFAGLVVLCSSAPLWADFQGGKKMGLEFWGGYTTAGMGDVNNALNSASSGGPVTKSSDGTLFAADFLWQAIPGVPRLSIGPRIEYLFISSAKLSQDAPLLNITEDFYVIPVLVGGRYLLWEKGDWSLNGALFFGVGIGYGKSAVNSAADPTNKTITKFSGSDIMEQLMIGGQYKIGDNTFLGVDLGYRQLSLGEMDIDSSSVSSLASGGGGGGGYSYAPSRAPVVNSSGSKIKYDFSGMILNIGINFKF